jgi:hypothetical protein
MKMPWEKLADVPTASFGEDALWSMSSQPYAAVTARRSWDLAFLVLYQ